MRDYQTKANEGGAADSLVSTLYGAGEYNSIQTELKGAVSRAGLTLAAQDGTSEDTSQLAQALLINGVKAGTFQDNGTANAIVLTPVSGSTGVKVPPDYTSLGGARIIFKAGTTNTSSTTISIGQTIGTQIGAKPVVDASGSALAAGTIVAGKFYEVIYDAVADNFALTPWANITIPSATTSVSGVSRLATSAEAVAGTATTPVMTPATTKVEIQTFAPLVSVGFVMNFAGQTPPANWLECNGAAVSRATYSDLFAIVGTTYGVGDGSTTFNLPDLRGEFVRGWDNGRGVDSGRSFGSTQSDLVGNHGHPWYHGTSIQSSTTAAATGGIVTTPSGSYTTEAAYSGTPSGTQGQQIGGSGGAETRPRNVAMLYIIKALKG